MHTQWLKCTLDGTHTRLIREHTPYAHAADGARRTAHDGTWMMMHMDDDDWGCDAAAADVHRGSDSPVCAQTMGAKGEAA